MTYVNPPPHHALPEIEDTGHTRVCPTCAKRFGENPFKRGKPRDIEIMECDTCKKAGPTVFDRRYCREV